MKNPPSKFVNEHLRSLGENQMILDFACGRGRHTRLALGLGHLVTAVDVDCSGLEDLRGSPGLTILERDLESEPWPFPVHSFDMVIVSNYLWRPLLSEIGAAVRPGGLLVYETFGLGNEAYGKPSNPDFLLKPGELFETFSPSFEVLHFNEGYEEQPKPAMRQTFAGRALGSS